MCLKTHIHGHNRLGCQIYTVGYVLLLPVVKHIQHHLSSKLVVSVLHIYPSESSSQVFAPHVVVRFGLIFVL